MPNDENVELLKRLRNPEYVSDGKGNMRLRESNTRTDMSEAAKQIEHMRTVLLEQVRILRAADHEFAAIRAYRAATGATAATLPTMARNDADSNDAKADILKLLGGPVKKVYCVIDDGTETHTISDSTPSLLHQPSRPAALFVAGVAVVAMKKAAEAMT